MRISKREVMYLYNKKIREGMSPSEAYNQINQEFKFLNSLPNKERKEMKQEEKDFKSLFKKLKHS